MPVRRLASALAAAALLATGLVGCSTAVNVPYDDSGCGVYRSGDASEAVRATGKGEPKISFPTPLTAKRIEVSQLRQGHGDRVGENDSATIGITLLDGRTGEKIQAVGYDGAFVQVAGRESGGTASLSRALTCRAEGARIAIAGPASELLDPAVVQRSGLPSTLPLVFVVDVKKRFIGKADGANRLQDNALPQVVTATDGQPGIVLPNVNEAPAEFRSAVVKGGGGAEIRKGDRVIVQFSSWDWADTATADTTGTTWTRVSAPAVVTAGEKGSYANADLPFTTRLVDQRVGSQLLYSYPQSKGTSTVWVVDVLGVV